MNMQELMKLATMIKIRIIFFWNFKIYFELSLLLLTSIALPNTQHTNLRLKTSSMCLKFYLYTYFDLILNITVAIVIRGRFMGCIRFLSWPIHSGIKYSILLWHLIILFQQLVCCFSIFFRIQFWSSFFKHSMICHLLCWLVMSQIYPVYFKC